MSPHFLSEPEDEEANLGPLADFFFVVLMVVLLHASFIKVSVNPEIAAAAKKDISAPRPIPVLVTGAELWKIAGQEVRGLDQIRAALSQLLTTQDSQAPAVLGVSFASGLPSSLSWEVRARLQHEWTMPFVEMPPHAE